eukprot:c19974_g2_i4.p1 GENE.c19974_g2_i4~~c19974_g2_i4.p1  ORF type:complete len:874 (+),score=219.81 c19974_g2_i4:1502-4123(+)
MIQKCTDIREGFVSLIVTDSKLESRRVALTVYRVPPNNPFTEEHKAKLSSRIQFLSQSTDREVIPVLEACFGPTTEGSDRMFWTISENIRGKSVSDMLEERTALDERIVVQIGLDCIACLQKYHAKDPSFLHGDITPESILQTGPALNPVFRLQPFTYRTFLLCLGESDDRTEFEKGEAFRSPAVVLGEAPRACDDIWSIGACLFSCLTRGAFPFASRKALVELQTPPALHEMKGCSLELVERVGDFMSKPQNRDSTAIQLSDAKSLLECVLVARQELVYHVYLSSPHTPALRDLSNQLCAKLKTERIGPQRESVRIFQGDYTTPRQCERSLYFLNNSLLFVPLVSEDEINAILETSNPTPEQQDSSQRNASIYSGFEEWKVAYREHVNDNSENLNGILPLICLPSNRESLTAFASTLPKEGIDPSGLVNAMLSFHCIESSKFLEESGEGLAGIAQQIQTAADSLAWMRRARTSQLRSQSSGSIGIDDGIVEVKVEGGPIGVKLSKNAPLKVLEILELPNGNPSPLKGKVDVGALLLGIDGRDTTQCSLADFKAVLMSESGSHILTFKTAASLRIEAASRAKSSVEKPRFKMPARVKEVSQRLSSTVPRLRSTNPTSPFANLISKISNTSPTIEPVEAIDPPVDEPLRPSTPPPPSATPELEQQPPQDAPILGRFAKVASFPVGRKAAVWAEKMRLIAGANSSSPMANLQAPKANVPKEVSIPEVNPHILCTQLVALREALVSKALSTPDPTTTTPTENSETDKPANDPEVQTSDTGVATDARPSQQTVEWTTVLDDAVQMIEYLASEVEKLRVASKKVREQILESGLNGGEPPSNGNPFGVEEGDEGANDTTQDSVKDRASSASSNVSFTDI